MDIWFCQRDLAGLICCLVFLKYLSLSLQSLIHKEDIIVITRCGHISDDALFFETYSSINPIDFAGQFLVTLRIEIHELDLSSLVIKSIIHLR